MDGQQRNRTGLDEKRRGRIGPGARGWRVSRGTGWAVTGLMVALLAGCDCDKERKTMEDIAAKGFEDALVCCRELAPLNPPSAEQCLLSLKEWRQQITTLIIQWYQACLDGNQDLASQMLQAAKALFAQGTNETCPSVQNDPTGQPRTAGLPFAVTDLLELSGRFKGEARSTVTPESDALARFSVAAPLLLRGGAFEATVFGNRIAGTLSGKLTVGSASADGSASVLGFEIAFETPAGALHCVLADPDRRSAIRATPYGLRLMVMVSLTADPGVPFLFPSEAWFELPVTAVAEGFALGGGARTLRAIAPPALGFADWQRDGIVDHADWSAYFSANADERDLDLDGDADPADDALFIESFRRATGK